MTEVASKSVPCGSCRLCCHGPMFLKPDEDATHLKVVDSYISGLKRRRLMLKANGDCIHLGDDGCTVYEHRPTICRIFDCREHFHMPAAQRRAREASIVDPRDHEILRRGRELVEQGS